jgi:hypothetical protein
MAAAMMESPAVSAVRSMVREIVLEDSKSFQDRTFGITYDENDISTTPARDLKRAWAAEADHDFFRKLIKVHWIKGLPGRMGNVSSFLPALLGASRKDEISVMGYVDKPKKTPWGEFGVMVQGRTTLAADNMNYIVSGYREDLDPEYIEKYSRTSGVPRRASMFDALTAKHYILDAESYGNKGEWGNELIVDNWEPVGIIAPTWFMQQVKEPWYAEAYREGGKGPEVIVMRTIIESGLPVYRTDGKPYNMGSIIKSLGLS